MSRSILIEYWDRTTGISTPIEVESPYDLLGCQETSMRFWSLPRLREVGIAQLTLLGEGDPVTFGGWDMMEDLWREIDLLQRHLRSLDFPAEIKARWAAHLAYCYFLLVESTPPELVPVFTIG